MVEQREDIGFGRQAAQRLHHPLAAAHAEQPIVNNCHSHRKTIESLPSDRLSQIMWVSPARGVSGRVLFQMATVGVCTGVVKIAGAAKVVLVARAFGMSDAMDPSLIPFLLPSFVADTFSGSLGPALVPTFLAVREKQGRAAAV